MENALCLAILASFAVSIGSACNSGWSGFDNSCYKVFTQTKDWSNAKHHCDSIGAHLAIVMSVEENDFLKQKLRDLNLASGIQVWMDGTDSAQENTFIWEKTGEYFEITDWGPNEPNQNGGDEDCLSFFGNYDFKWNDEHCDKAFPFVCEKEQSAIIG